MQATLIFLFLYVVRRLARKRRKDGEPSLDSTGLSHKVHICSVNNFPTAAGLASSAAGFACLGESVFVSSISIHDRNYTDFVFFILIAQQHRIRKVQTILCCLRVPILQYAVSISYLIYLLLTYFPLFRPYFFIPVLQFTPWPGCLA